MLNLFYYLSWLFFCFCGYNLCLVILILYMSRWNIYLSRFSVILSCSYLFHFLTVLVIHLIFSLVNMMLNMMFFMFDFDEMRILI